MKNIEIKKTKRSFGGKIDNFSDKQEQAFEKKHLKAYLNGDKKFRHGFFTDMETGTRQPAWFDVKEIWK